MLQLSRFSRIQAVFALAALAGLGTAWMRRDLDVAVPPGTALEWGRAFPASLPFGGELFPESSGEPLPEERGPETTTARTRRARLEVRLASSFALVRVLTFDLRAHLRWLARVPTLSETRAWNADPIKERGLFWVSLAPMLRFLLHRASVSEAETLAHLAEIGTPTYVVLDAAAHEGALRGTVRSLKKILETRDPVRPRVAARTGRDAMLSTFVYEELLASEPYDPEANFGQRLFLFGDSLEPYVAELALRSTGRLRRNAVAALGRYRTVSATETLVSLAAETRDMVVLVRALAALADDSPVVDWAPLLERLDDPHSEVEGVALMAALGRIGYRPAIPTLLRLGKRGLNGAPDLLMTALASLARMGSFGRDREEVLEFAEKVRRKLTDNPRGFRPKHSANAPSADLPDAPETRARILSQLVRILRVRAGSREPEHVAALLELASEQPDSSWRTPRGFMNMSIGNVQPYGRYLFIDALVDAGSRGQELLVRIASDPQTEPSLRGWALARLPWKLRIEHAPPILKEEAQGPEMRSYALQVLAFDGGETLELRLEQLIEECGEAEPGTGTAEQRNLWLAAVRTASQRRSVSARELLPLLAHAKTARDSFGSLIDRLIERAGELVELAASGPQKRHLEEAVDELLEVVVAHHINPAIDTQTRGGARDFIIGQLASASAQRRNEDYLATLVDAVAEYMLGMPVGEGESAPGLFTPDVPLEEEILLALGRTREPLAIEALVAFLGNKQSRYRAIACLALGLADEPSLAGQLTPFLLDNDPFTRYCAYESLRHLTDKDFFVDWFHGPAEERTRQAEAYWKWIHSAPERR